jgi:hypothetical protein
LGLFPKPEKGSENTVNDYKRRSNMHPSLEEPILTDKSRLYKQTLSFKGCSIPQAKIVFLFNR